MPKILFIYEYEYVEPLGIMTLSAFLKKHGYNCDFIDLAFEKDYVQSVLKIKPDVIGYSIITGKHKFFSDINRELKNHLNFVSVFGGPHPTFFPDYINEEGIDIICRGEGENALLELLVAMDNKVDLTKIMNLWVKQKGEVFRNEIREPLSLETIPVPDRELVNKYKHYRFKKIRFVMTSRGCPYSCTYCFNNGLKKIYESKHFIRQQSCEKAISDLLLIKNQYHPKRFKFIDDIFTLNKDWILHFCKRYKNEIGLPFIAHVRANLIDEDIVIALKNAGCTLVEFGIESGNEFIRNKILKRNMSDKQIIDAGRLFKKHKIKTLSFNIMGLPEETVDNAMETLQLNVESNIDYAWCGIFHPLPMTELTEHAIQKGYYDGRQFLLNNYYIFKRSELKMKDIEKLDRFHFLLSVGVAFPVLKPFIKFLINIPLRKPYQWIYFLHRSYNYFFKLGQIDLNELFIFEKK